MLSLHCKPKKECFLNIKVKKFFPAVSNNPCSDDVHRVDVVLVKPLHCGHPK